MKLEGNHGKWEQVVDYSLKHHGKTLKVGENDVSRQNSSLIGKITKCFCGKDLNQIKTTADNLRSHLRQYWDDKISAMQSEMKLPETTIGALRRDAQIAIDDLVERFLSPETFNESGKKSSQLVAEAQKNVHYKLMELKTQYGNPEFAPSVTRTKDGHYCLIKKAPLIENLVLQGGGLKGLGYIGAISALDKLGIIKNVKSIAGTSIGSLMASLVACGNDSSTLPQWAMGLKLLQLCMGLKKPGQLKVGFGFCQGASLLSMLEKMLPDCVAKKLHDDKDKFGEDAKFSSEEWSRIRELEQNNTNKPLTFSDLRLLHKFSPEKFKELTITGFNKTDQKEMYFNADTSPQKSIAEAARISMSLPFIFGSVRHEVDGHTVQMVDGGCGSNLPTETFIRSFMDPNFISKDSPFVADQEPDSETRKDLSKTMSLQFDDNGTCSILSHAPLEKRRGTLPGRMSILLSGNRNYKADEMRNAQKAYHSGPNIMPVFHGNLKTLSVFASKKTNEKAFIASEIRALEHLSIRQNQAEHQVFTDLKTLFDSLSTNELEMMIQTPETEDDIRKSAEKALTERNSTPESPTVPILHHQMA